MGSPANSSSLITSKRNPLLLLLSACSQLLLLNQKLRLMPMLCMDTMDMLPTHTPMVMPTMDTMDTHMPTMDTTTARDLLMLSQRPRLMLMPLSSMELMDMLPTHTPMVMPTTDTMDTHMPTMDTTTARDLLMLKLSQRPRLMLMLSMDTMDMPTHTPMDITDMPTMDTTDTPGHTVMLTGVKM